MQLTAAPDAIDGPNVGVPRAAASDWKIIATLAFLAIAGTGSSAIIYAATPMFIKVFAEPKIIGWMSSIYFIVGAIGAGLCGGIGDLYGRRATMLWILALVSIAGIVAGSMSNPLYVVAAHAVQGLGVAAPTLNMGLIREHIAPRRVPLAIAIVTTATTATAGLFFMAAGYIMDHSSWRYIFWCGPFLLVPAMIALLLVVPRSAPSNKPRSIPVVNGLLFGMSALLLMVGVGELSQGGFAYRPLGILGLGILFMIGWIVNSLKIPVPMVNVRMLGQRGMAGIMVVYALLSLTMFHFGHVLLFVGKAASHDGYGAGLSGTAIATILAPQGFIGLLIGPFTGVLVQRYGHFKVFSVVLAFSCLPYLTLLLVSHSQITLLAVVLIAGMTGGALGPAFRIALQEEVDASQASSAMGLAELLRALCMGLGAQVVASALVHGQGAAGHAAAGGPPLDPTRFTLLIGGFVVLMASSAVVYFIFGSRQGKIGDSPHA
ncbi:MAG: MFS transporter [Sphingobium sp.]